MSKDYATKLEEFSKAAGFKTYQDPELVKMIKATSEFWGSVMRQEDPKWLVLIGETGTGKTHLGRKLNALAKKFCRLHDQGDKTLGPRTEGRSYNSRFFSWPGISAGFYRGEYAAVQDMQNEWFAVIDDIGSTRAKMDDLVIDQLFQVLDGRHDKWTVITTNRSLEDLARIDARIQDRLIRRNSRVVTCVTISYSMRASSIDDGVFSPAHRAHA